MFGRSRERGYGRVRQDNGEPPKLKKTRSARALTGVYAPDSFAGHFLVHFGYLYAVLLTLSSFLWYPANSYMPNVLYYHYYPMSLAIGGMIGAIWRKKQMFLMIQFLGGVLSIADSIFFLVVYAQSDFPTNIFSSPDGFTFPTSGGHLTITAENLVGIPSTWLDVGLALVICNLAFGAGAVIMAVFSYVKVARREFKTSPENQWESGLEMFYPSVHYDHKARIAVTWVCALGTVMTIGLSIATMVGCSLSVQLYSPFTNQMTWLLTLMVVGISPPETIDKEFGETFSLTLHGITPEGLHWLTGLFLSYGVLLAGIIYTAGWRSQNSLPTVCVSLTPFEDQLGDTVFFFGYLPGEQLFNVTYTAASGGSGTIDNSMANMTCMDDWVNIIISAMGGVVFIIGSMLQLWDGFDEKARRIKKLQEDIKTETLELEGKRQQLNSQTRLETAEEDARRGHEALVRIADDVRRSVKQLVQAKEPTPGCCDYESDGDEMGE
jgi:hypothetical protein